LSNYFLRCDITLCNWPINDWHLLYEENISMWSHSKSSDFYTDCNANNYVVYNCQKLNMVINFTFGPCWHYLRSLFWFSSILCFDLGLEIDIEGRLRTKLHNKRDAFNFPIVSFPFICSKKSLKIPKGWTESVYRKRTDNTMAKRKCTKGQTTFNKTNT